MPDRTVLDATAVRIMTALRDPIARIRRVAVEEPAPLSGGAHAALKAS